MLNRAGLCALRAIASTNISTKPSVHLIEHGAPVEDSTARNSREIRKAKDMIPLSQRGNHFSSGHSQTHPLSPRPLRSNKLSWRSEWRDPSGLTTDATSGGSPNGNAAMQQSSIEMGNWPESPGPPSLFSQSISPNLFRPYQQ
jgi:hypothetical protein